MNRRLFMGGLFSTAAATAVAGKSVKSTYVDSFIAPITTETRDVPQKNYGAITEESVLAELADNHHIVIPSRKSLLFTEELRRKRDILKRLVHKNKVMIDYSIANPNDETSETCMVYWLPADGKTPLDYYK